MLLIMPTVLKTKAFVAIRRMEWHFSLKTHPFTCDNSDTAKNTVVTSFHLEPDKTRWQKVESEKMWWTLLCGWSPKQR